MQMPTSYGVLATWGIRSRKKPLRRIFWTLFHDRSPRLWNRETKEPAHVSLRKHDPMTSCNSNIRIFLKKSVFLEEKWNMRGRRIAILFHTFTSRYVMKRE